jgi:hypothetical protein
VRVTALLGQPDRWIAEAAVLGQDSDRFMPVPAALSAHREGPRDRDRGPDRGRLAGATAAAGGRGTGSTGLAAGGGRPVLSACNALSQSTPS